MTEKTWREYIEQAAHYKAIGETKIHLYGGDEMDKPWEFVTKVEPGSLWRYNISVSTSFAAKVSGLDFSWSIDLEFKDANGTAGLHINLPKANKILALLPAENGARNIYREQLRATAKEARKQADESQAFIDKQYRMARELETI